MVASRKQVLLNEEPIGVVKWIVPCFSQKRDNTV